MSYNLDSYLMSKDVCRQVFAEKTTDQSLVHSLFSSFLPFEIDQENADDDLDFPTIHIVEAAMGLFDGVYGGASESNPPLGSAAFLAKTLDIPIVLVIDAASYAQSIAATVQGFINLDPKLKFLGVIVNKVASLKHKELIQEAFEVYCPNIPLLAILPKNLEIELEARQLGLNFEVVKEKNYFNLLADWLENNFEQNLVDFIKKLPVVNYDDGQNNQKTESSSALAPSLISQNIHNKKLRIGVARDKTFCFHYVSNYQALSQEGAELVFFSPEKDKVLPKNLNALWLGGGYAELYAKELSSNLSMLTSIHDFLEQGNHVWAEGAGFIYLGKGLTVQNSEYFPFVQYFPLTFCMEKKRQGLGYVEANFEASVLIAQKNTQLKGHLFHYTKVVETEFPKGVQPLYALTNYKKESISEDKIIGCVKNGTQNAGGFVHILFTKHDNIARNFLNMCKGDSLIL